VSLTLCHLLENGKERKGKCNNLWATSSGRTQNLSVLALIDGLGYTVQWLNRPNTLLGRIQSQPKRTGYTYSATPYPDLNNGSGYVSQVYPGRIRIRYAPGYTPPWTYPCWWAREFDFTIWDGFLLSLYLFFCECCLLHWLISNAWQRENNPFGINWELCILRSTNDAVLDEMKKAYMVEQEDKEKNQ
jgi:hypothetical protein